METLITLGPDSEEQEYPDTTIEALDAAKEAGHEVLVADDLVLMLDLDTAADLTVWQRLKHRLPDLGVKALSIESWASKSGNTHVLIRMESPLPIIHRIGLQAVLGSDRRREFLSFRDVDSKYEYPVMLFRPKGAKVTTEY